MEKKIKKRKEYIHAEEYRRSRQSSEESPDPGGRRLLSSSRPLMAPKGRIQRTPSREVSDADTDSLNEPEPTPVTVVGDSPPKFKVEIASSGANKSGFFIETIESRATTSQPAKDDEPKPEKPELENQPIVKLVPEPEIMATVTTTTQAAAPPPAAPSPDSTRADVTSAATTSAPDGLDQLIKAISELPMKKLGPFLCLICVSAFVSSAAELDPTWLVLLTSLSSFILFYVLKV